jgi:hypothetical protein
MLQSQNLTLIGSMFWPYVELGEIHRNLKRMSPSRNIQNGLYLTEKDQIINFLEHTVS